MESQNIGNGKKKHTKRAKNEKNKVLSQLGKSKRVRPGQFSLSSWLGWLSGHGCDRDRISTKWMQSQVVGH